jgi:transcriptional regulator with XRE-family HTH domain
MISKKKKPVAVLRLMLGLTVEEFAFLIRKSPSTLMSLETGRLALSEETANTIARRTGVAVAWLLEGNSKQKPYVSIALDGSKEPYTKEHFERIQAALQASKQQVPKGILKPEQRLIGALARITDWISVYNKAQENGEAELVAYLMHSFLEDLVERFGKDDDETVRINAKARITTSDGTKFAFIQHEPGDRIHLWFADKDKPAVKKNEA